MSSPKPLDKDLYALRHRAQELSKGIGKAMQELHKNNNDCSAVLNQFSVVSSQLLNIQTDIENNVGLQLNKFTLQPSHGHFNCSTIGIKKLPQIVENTNKYYTNKDNKFIKNYDESELINQLNDYNKMLARLDQFNSICIVQTKNNDKNENDDGDGDEKMKEIENKNIKINRKKDKYLVEYMFCGQTPEQRARMASEEPSDDEFH
eukprot:516250_1